MTIWWCDTHGAAGEVDPVWGTLGCWKRGAVGTSCVLVEMQLLPIPTATEVLDAFAENG